MNYMKLSLSIFVIALMFAISCSKIADVNFDATYSANLECEVPPASRGGFSAEDEIDPLSNSDVAKYIDNIKDFEIIELIADITAITKEVKLLSADLEIYSGSKKASWHIENVNLVLNESLILDNSNGQWDTVKDILSEKKTFYVSIIGQTEEDDVTFTIKVSISGKVTASPL